jgi:hypothetical protein
MMIHQRLMRKRGCGVVGDASRGVGGRFAFSARSSLAILSSG